MTNNGIDISEFQGTINFSKIKNSVGFIMIRAGYGDGHIDAKAHEYAQKCEEFNIPYGFYWFSYAHNIETAIRESNHLCDFADKYNPTFPLAFDFEYDSDRYVSSTYHSLSNDERYNIAKEFLLNIEKRGYYACIYANPDYISNKGFKNLLGRFALWLAQWGTNSPSYNYVIWQTGSINYDGKEYDFDVSPFTGDDFMKALSKPIGDDINKCKVDCVDYFLNKCFYKYYLKAKEVIQGKYGINEERRKRLNADGYDSDIVQHIVNFILR